MPSPSWIVAAGPGAGWGAASLAGASSRPGAVRPPADESDRVEPVVRWGLYAYAFCFPVEIPDRIIPVEIHTFVGCIFLLCTLLQPRVCFRRPPAALGWFLAYVCFYALQIPLTDHLATALRRLLTNVQLIFLTWAICNLMQYPRIAKTALLLEVYACTMLAIMQITGIAAETGPEEALSVAGRVTVLGQNPNTLGYNLVLGTLISLGLGYGLVKSAIRPSYLWLLVGIMGFAIVQTGSRGAMLALLCGVWPLALRGGSVHVKLRNAFVAVVAVVLLILAAFQSETASYRLEHSLTTGDMTKREFIFPAAWDMFLEKPLTGWGPVNNNYELGVRVPRNDRPYRESHNFVLEVLTESGILGAIPLCVCIGLCIRGGWRGRKGTFGILPACLLVAAFLECMQTAGLYSKATWFVLAFALASGSQLSQTGLRRPAQEDAQCGS